MSVVDARLTIPSEYHTCPAVFEPYTARQHDRAYIGHLYRIAPQTAAARPVAVENRYLLTPEGNIVRYRTRLHGNVAARVQAFAFNVDMPFGAIVGDAVNVAPVYLPKWTRQIGIRSYRTDLADLFRFADDLPSIYRDNVLAIEAKHGNLTLFMSGAHCRPGWTIPQWIHGNIATLPY